ncbi:MAG: hypothetical protein QF473_05685 [Planctomycetota bacterium]|jgi:hypothetical protein|nr:hypothetical protein [Planctomycetota bacterium]
MQYPIEGTEKEQNMKLILLILAAVLFGKETLACKCAPPPPPVPSLKKCHAVFLGQVVSLKHHKEYGKLVTFKVQDSWKGKQGDTVVVRTGIGGGDCGYSFVKGKNYLIYGYNSKGTLWASICSRTRPLGRATADIKELDEFKKEEK